MSLKATHVRVADGAIAEQYITKEMIAARGHPEGWYVPIVQEAIPPLDEFHYARPIYKLMGNVTPDENGFFKDCHVQVTFVVQERGLRELLRVVWQDKDPFFDSPMHTDMENKEPVQLMASEIAPAMYKAICAQAKKQTQDLLDQFAKSRDYDSIEKLCSYKDSVIDAWASEAAQGILVRDGTWQAFHEAINAIDKGEVGLFRTFSELRQKFPAAVWETETNQGA